MVPAPVNLTPIDHKHARGSVWRRVGGAVGMTAVLVTVGLVPSGVWQPYGSPPGRQITIRSVDTVKYSRDMAGQMLNEPAFDQTIYRQVSLITQAHANYVAIDTPYDDEFLPFLRRWVQAARINHLHVWFRGNFAGWEGWFNYPKIDRVEHMIKLKHFIEDHADLFEDGDLFSPCPECENGGPGDPRLSGDLEGFRVFMIAEYKASQEAFNRIGKNVTSNANSMNYDVARLVMDKQTTIAMGGTVVIDHYVSRPGELTAAVDALAASSDGRVILGEFGAPIPDINGTMTQSEQAGWLHEAANALIIDPNLAGLNYWTSFGGSTELWDEAGNARLAAGAISDAYGKLDASPGGTLQDELAWALHNLDLTYGGTLQAK